MSSIFFLFLFFSKLSWLSLPFNVNYRNSLSTSIKTLAGIFIAAALNLHIRKNQHLNSIESPNPWIWFTSLSIFLFFSVVQVLVYFIYIFLVISLSILWFWCCCNWCFKVLTIHCLIEMDWFFLYYSLWHYFYVST